jgi:hypothetical protein
MYDFNIHPRLYRRGLLSYFDKYVERVNPADINKIISIVGDIYLQKARQKGEL